MPARISVAIAMVVTACAGAPAVARGAVPDWPDAARLGSAAPFTVRDTTIPATRLRQSTPSPPPYGGDYSTPGGTVRVIESPSYDPAPAVLQAWANFFGALPHGSELSQLTVYLAPYSEMQHICSPEADSCYAPENNEIVLVGNSPPDSNPIEDIAAHEYGHHIANHRDNAPWNAEDWGPKYWATYENVCNRVAQHQAFPSAEPPDARYFANPGEDWAETYRTLTGSKSAWTFSPLFAPDARALAAARRDVLKPWTGVSYEQRRGSFRRGDRSRWRNFVLPVENDGALSVTITATGSLDPDLFIYKSLKPGPPIDKSTRSGHVEQYGPSTYCGYRHLDFAVYRYRGSGTFTIKVTLPFST